MQTDVLVGPGDWVLSHHALQRAFEMGVTEETIVLTIEEAEVTYPSRDGRSISKRGALAVCWIGHVIVTVLPNTYDIYLRPEVPQCRRSTNHPTAPRVPSGPWLPPLQWRSKIG